MDLTGDSLPFVDSSSTNKTVTPYSVNGVTFATKALAGAIYNSTRPITVGGDQGTSYVRWYYGLLDNVKLEVFN